MQSSANDDKLVLWHCRLGYLNVKSVQALRGMDIAQSRAAPSSFICEGCIEGKQHRLPFPVNGATPATKPLELVHSDVCGPMKTTSIGETKYFVTFIDGFQGNYGFIQSKLKASVLTYSKSSRRWLRINERRRSRCCGRTMEASSCPTNLKSF